MIRSVAFGMGIIGVAVAAAAPGAVAGAGTLTDVSALAPDVRLDIRYATPRNFVGRRLPGYAAQKCLLVRPAAEALARLQADLVRRSPPLTLKLFDCYRPMRAVRAMVAWTQASEVKSGDPFYYPAAPRRRLVALGYIASRSAHASGIAVDLTLARLSDRPAAITPPKPRPAQRPASRQGKPNGLVPPGPLSKGGVGTCRSRGGSSDDPLELDMGTTFDCFDPLSATQARGVTREQAANRALLVAAMARHGFRNYAREWWHFTYRHAGRPPALDGDVR